MSMDSIIQVLLFYRLNKMLIDTKHIVDNILHVTLSKPKPLNFTFSDLRPQQPKCDWWTPLIKI